MGRFPYPPNLADYVPGVTDRHFLYVWHRYHGAPMVQDWINAGGEMVWRTYEEGHRDKSLAHVWLGHRTLCGVRLRKSLVVFAGPGEHPEDLRGLLCANARDVGGWETSISDIKLR